MCLSTYFINFAAARAADATPPIPFATPIRPPPTLPNTRTLLWSSVPDTEETIALDFGLTTLFGTSQGQLLGVGWLKRLKVIDTRIQNIARGVQKRGGKLRDNARYQAAIQDMRGFLTTEIHRVLNRLVAERKPTELIVEHLDFRNPNLSRRLNRLLSNCGRSIVTAKLTDLKERYGITSGEVNPAYTSQTCSRPGCGYVDARNRTSQGRFHCLWCGSTRQADLNAASNIRARRACPNGWKGWGKATALAELVRAFSGSRRFRAANDVSSGDIKPKNGRSPEGAFRAERSAPSTLPQRGAQKTRLGSRGRPTAQQPLFPRKGKNGPAESCLGSW